MTCTERAAVPNSPVTESTALSCVQEKTLLENCSNVSLKRERETLLLCLFSHQSPEVRRTPSSRLSSGSQNHRRSRWRSCCTEPRTSHLDSNPDTRRKCTKSLSFWTFHAFILFFCYCSQSGLFVAFMFVSANIWSNIIYSQSSSESNNSDN